MKATEMLLEEHAVIEHVLTAMQRAAQVSEGTEVRPAFFINAAVFMKNFADGCHLKKEEGVLFIAMNAAGVPAQGGPIGVMLAEHEQERFFTREMRDAAEKWEKGNQSARMAVAQNALRYVAQLRQLINKDNNTLFPMADRVMTPGQQEKVAEDFERIEQEETGAGIHEKYLALAEVLEKESARLP